jgi:hypothetical protein
VFEARDVTVGGRDYHVELCQDTDSSLEDAECWNDEDIRAYKAGDWSFIGIIVTLLDDDGGETQFSDSLWGVQYGYTAEWDAGLDRLVSEYPVPDMISEIAGRAAEHRRKHRGWWRYPPAVAIALICAMALPACGQAPDVVASWDSAGWQAQSDGTVFRTALDSRGQYTEVTCQDGRLARCTATADDGSHPAIPASMLPRKGDDTRLGG